jgi:predicted unusual protein kinase regulating ubiquinone biosynthesis (AarF/ABC1/UbiB family)
VLSGITQASTRQREIIEVVFRNGWDYMRQLLLGSSRTGEPELPPPAILRNVLTELGPVYVKLGQLLSTRPDLLAPEYIDALSDLQAKVPSVPWSEIETVIRQELDRPINDVFESIDSTAIAAGSIAQIHRAVLKDGQAVAIKVQRPGIGSVVEQDISLVRTIAELVSRTNFGQYYDVVSLADEFANALNDELDFNKEAGYTDLLRQNLSKSRWFDPEKIVVPAIKWELTGKKILVMEWLDGVPILTAEMKGKGYNGDVKAERQEVMRLMFRVFFQQLYIDGFFHADPHPGNVFYLNDGRIALLDCGMVGRLDPRTQDLLTEMVLAIVGSDAQRCSQLTIKLATAVRPVNLMSLESDYDYLLRKYYSLSLSELNFSQAFYEVLQAARRNHLRWPSNLGLYAKSLANLEGLGRKFYPDVNLLDEVRPLVTDIFRRQLVGDDPLQTLLRTSLELKNLTLESPRRFEFLLDRLSSETLKWNLSLREIDGLRLTIDDSANRLSFSVVVGALIMGAAILASKEQVSQFYWVSIGLFIAASLIGLWLLISIIRSGKLR